MSHSDLLNRLLGVEPKKNDAQFSISELRIGDKQIKLGAFQIVETYSGLSVPLALYAMQQMILDVGAPFVVNYKDFASPPAQQVIKTNIDTTSTTFINYFTMYDGMMVTCHMVSGHLIVTVYADSESSGTAFFKKLADMMRIHNFYRGKCLYFSGNDIEFVKTPTVSWDDVIVEADLKKEVQLNAEDFFFNDEYRRLKLFKRGLILHGPPGTGKTSIVRAVFSRLENSGVTRVYLTNETFNRMDMSSFFKTLHYLLPAVVVFEDIDLIGGDRSVSRSHVIGALLNHMDGVDKITEPLVIIGTTNDLEALDSALRNRPARFDRCLEVPAPKPDQIIQFYKKLTGIEPCKQLVEKSSGFTGAHIGETVNTAFMLALQDGKKRREDLKPEEMQQMLLVAAKYVQRNFPMKGTNGTMGFGARKSDDDGMAAIDPSVDYPDESPFDLDPEDFPNRDNT